MANKKPDYFSHSYYWFTADINGHSRSFFNALAVHHHRLQIYNSNMKLEEILLFEKLVIVFRSWNRKPFFYQSHRLQEELRIGRIRLENAFKKLLDWGIVKQVSVSRGSKTFYKIDKQKIIEHLSEIYEMPEDVEDRKFMLEKMEEFFHHYLTKDGFEKDPYEGDKVPYQPKKRLNLVENNKQKK